MDGIFVAYHNTARIFGFQYLSISDMDERLFGNRTGGDRVFAKCVELLDTIAEAITEVSPEQVCTKLGRRNCATPTYHSP